MFFGQYPESRLDPVVLLEQQFDGLSSFKEVQTESSC